MRSYNTNTIFYNPGTPPSDPRDFTRFWMDESIKIQNAINALIAGHLDETHVAPTKPRTGDIRLADGTNGSMSTLTAPPQHCASFGPKG